MLQTLRLDRAGLSRAERLVVTFGLGNGGVVFEMFLFSLGNIPLTPWALAIPWILGGGRLLYRRRQRERGLLPIRLPGSNRATGPSRPPGSIPRWVWWELLLVAVLGLSMLAILTATLTAPFLSGDAISFWTPKAKIFYHYRLTPSSAFSALHEFAHPDYPLFLPLTEAWLFLWMGAVNEYSMKLLFPVYAGILVVATWAFVGRFFGQRSGLTVAAVLASTPLLVQQAAQGYADVLLALFFWLATALLLVWFREADQSSLILAAVFLGLTGFVKNEGLPFIVLNGILFAGHLVARRTSGRGAWLRPAVLFGGVTLGIVLPWLAVRYALGLESDLRVPPLDTVVPLALQRLRPLGTDLIRALFAPSSVWTTWNLTWYLLLLVIALDARALWRSPLRYPTLLIAGQVLVYVSVYTVTPYDVDWHIATSLDRLLLHLYPLALWPFGWYLAARLPGSTPETPESGIARPFRSEAR